MMTKGKGTLFLLAVLAAAFALTGCTRTEPGPETTAVQETAVTEEASGPSAESTSEAWEEVTLTVPGAEGEISLQAAAVELSYFDGCPLIRSDDAPADMVRNIAGFRETLEHDYGMKVGIHADWLAPGEEIPAFSREILMGRSNRPESEAADGLREGDYLIRLENAGF